MRPRFDAHAAGRAFVMLSSVGCYGAIGPKVAYSTKHGPSIGYELSAGVYAREFNVGFTGGRGYALHATDDSRGGSTTDVAALSLGVLARDQALRGLIELGGAWGLDHGAFGAARAMYIVPSPPTCDGGDDSGFEVFLSLRAGGAASGSGIVELIGQVGGVSRACRDFHFFVPGRRLRSEDGIVLPPVALLGNHEVRRSTIARAWIEDARVECASVTAFIRMAAELRAVGAPAELSRAARAAAVDELQHTRMCASLAGEPFALLPIDGILQRPRWSAPSVEALCHLAREAWNDGCVAEGIAAAHAASAASRCAGTQHEAQQIIAADELHHAELAWAVLEWLWRCGGSQVRDTIVELVDDEDATWRQLSHEVADDVDIEQLAAAGRLDTNFATLIAVRDVDRTVVRGRRLVRAGAAAHK